MKRKMLKRKECIVAYLFVLPSFLGITVFYIVPYIICFIKSLYIGNTFVGIENYIQLFQNNTFLLALKNTAVFTIIAIPLLMVISFLIALFLNSFKKISNFFRSALLIPVVVPIASLIYVWQVVFDDYGAINVLMNSLGLNTIEFFNSEFSMLMIIFIYVWKYCGFCVILFTAGLANCRRHSMKAPDLTALMDFSLLQELQYH